MTTQRALAVVSGGLDSTTMVYDLLAQGYKVDMISFNYGQRHKKELQFAKMTAAQLDLRHDIVDLSGLTHLISNSALTSNSVHKGDGEPNSQGFIDVPEGHYAQDNMKLTVVPNRNMIMMSIAAGVAINRQANTIATAVHAGDHFVYPDCRPEFIFALGQAIITGNEGFHSFGRELDPEKDAAAVAQGYTHAAMPITTPYLQSTKADIAYKALELGTPLHMTWSCYKGGLNHCGRCGTCVERLEAIDAAAKRYTLDQGWAAMKDGKALVDSTVYDDNEYWKTVIQKG